MIQTPKEVRKSEGQSPEVGGQPAVAGEQSSVEIEVGELSPAESVAVHKKPAPESGEIIAEQGTDLPPSQPTEELVPDNLATNQPVVNKVGEKVIANAIKATNNNLDELENIVALP